jgi:hypothetical protein
MGVGIMRDEKLKHEDLKRLALSKLSSLFMKAGDPF